MTRPRSYRLTPQEERQVRIALRYLAVRCGHRRVLARALCMKDDSIARVITGRRHVTAELAFRVSRMAKISMDALLSGEMIPPGTCPHCGHAPDEDQRRASRFSKLNS